eukprot:GDKI01033192.1.p1 GENE.GDKI01033192.1~~GDKI01033192.1.p1  ORF type:complete len:1084 (-),score=367.52 GDKI01033192.1:907-4158(-)
MPLSTQPADGSEEVPLDIDTDTKYTLFSGTTVIQAKGQGDRDAMAVAMVARVGYRTMQGKLMRSILFPPPNRFSFFQDSMTFILMMFILCFLGAIWAVYALISQGAEDLDIVTRILDLFTIAVPPALPCAMSVGTRYAIQRLKKLNVTCISPSRVDVSGQVNVMCFDKTGTLTEEGLQFAGLLPVEHLPQKVGEFGASSAANTASIGDSTKLHMVHELLHTRAVAATNIPVTWAMATCHAVMHVNGEAVGDPVDLLMFEFTKWQLEERTDMPNVCAIVKPPLTTVDEVPKAKQLMHKQSTLERIGQALGNAAHAVVEVVRRHSGSHGSQHGSHQGSADVSRHHSKDLAASPMNMSAEHGHHTAHLHHHGTGLAEIKEDEELKEHPGLEIIKRFDFNSVLQRMAVLARDPSTGEMMVFCKGSPERLMELAPKGSLAPNLNTVLREYTQKGMRVLAIGGKSLGVMSVDDALKLSRETIESELTLLSLLVFANQLKSATKPAMEILRGAGVHCLMATGDNALTAIAVARDCALIDSEDRVVIMGDVEQGKTLMWTRFGNPAQGLTDATSEDLLEFLEKRDPRESNIVLTGRAFRHLKAKFESQVNVWCGSDNTKHSKANKSGLGKRRSSLGNTLGQKEVHVTQHDADAALYLNLAVDDVKGKNTATGVVTKEGGANTIRMALFEYILRHSTVFARMSPDDKADLVMAIQSLPHSPLVGMCGDGANDCAALKTADIGVALSDAEASIAAPFTSGSKTIQSVVDTLLQGRCALLNSFSVFKYMAYYSMIQFTTCLILAKTPNQTLTDPQFLVFDLFLVLPLVCVMTRTEAPEKLIRSLPLDSLMTAAFVVPIIGHIFIQGAFQVGCYIWAEEQPYFKAWDDMYWNQEVDERYGWTVENGLPVPANRGAADWQGVITADIEDDGEITPETICGRACSEGPDASMDLYPHNTVLYMISHCSYLWTALISTWTAKYRKPMYTNLVYMVVVFICFCMSVFYLCLDFQSTGKQNWLALNNLPWDMRWPVILFSFGELAAHVLFQVFVCEPMETARSAHNWEFNRMNRPLPDVSEGKNAPVKIWALRHAGTAQV